MNAFARLGCLRVFTICLLLTLMAPAAFALSRQLPGPDINFPKGYDKARAARIVTALSEPKLKYADGIVSYWPPEWGTTLIYNGDTEALNALLADLHGIQGVSVAVSFSVVVSLRPDTIDLEKLHLPVAKGSE